MKLVKKIAVLLLAFGGMCPVMAQTEGVLGFPEGAVRVLFSMIGPALAGLCILYGYNGERAKKGRQVLKWFFYGFYPLHLLLLWLAARAMGTM